MSFENDSVAVIKKWIFGSQTVEAIKSKNKLSFVVKEGNHSVEILAHNIEGIPKEIRYDLTKIEQFFAESYVKVSRLDNNEFKLYIHQRGKGGANIINPNLEPNKLWPKGIVPYEIDSTKYPVGEKEREMILSAIADWNNSGTGFTLIPRTTQKDYVIFGEADGYCNSYVGRMGGAQYVRCDLDGGGFNAGSVKHEIGHAIGFYHEHQRPDRDSYVTVSGGKKADYGKEGNAFGQYDFKSIMHYYFDKNLQPKVRVDNPNQVGNSGNLSAGDKAAAHYLYQSSLNYNVPANENLTPNTLRRSSRFFKAPQWEVLKQKGDEYRNNGNYVQAFHHYSALLNEYGQSLTRQFKSELSDLCGICAYYIGEFQNAADWFEQALNLDQHNTNADKNLRLTQQKIEELNNQVNSCLII